MSEQSFVLVYCVYFMSTDNILVQKYEIYFVFVWNVTFEVFFPFPNLCVEDVHIDKFSKILLRTKI
jgi:hypothetical protein